jgi:hypothetical protein
VQKVVVEMKGVTDNAEKAAGLKSVPTPAEEPESP